MNEEAMDQAEDIYEFLRIFFSNKKEYRITGGLALHRDELITDLANLLEDQNTFP